MTDREYRLRQAICDTLPDYLTADQQVASILRMLNKELGTDEWAQPEQPAAPDQRSRQRRRATTPKRRRTRTLKVRTKTCPQCDGQGYIPGEGSCGFCFGRGVLADPPLKAA